MWLRIFTFSFLSREWIREEEGNFGILLVPQCLGALFSGGCHILTIEKFIFVIANTSVSTASDRLHKHSIIQGHFHEYLKLAKS